MPFGNYYLDYEIASGGMGTVYFARQLSMDREVAVKVLSRRAMSMPGVLDRFRSEAVLAGRLRHPGIVTVYETGENGGIYFIAMELISGVSMGDLIKAKGVLAFDEALYYLRSIADALGYAAQAGTIHKDVKPHNILIDGDDRPRLTDFGLAEMIAEGASGSQIVGTPSYIAPEVIRGMAADQRADIYSFGCTLYHAVCGEPPFSGAALRETLKLHLTTPPRPPIAIRPRIPADLNEFILALLEKDRDARLQNWHQVLFRMDRLISQHGWAAKEHVPCPGCTKPMRRNDVVCTRCGLNVKTGDRLRTLGSVRPLKAARPRTGNTGRIVKPVTARIVNPALAPKPPSARTGPAAPPAIPLPGPAAPAVSPPPAPGAKPAGPSPRPTGAVPAGSAAKPPSSAPAPATAALPAAADSASAEPDGASGRSERGGTSARAAGRIRRRLRRRGR